MEKNPNQDLLDFIEEIEKKEQEEVQRKGKAIAPFLWGALVGGVVSLLQITPSQIGSFFSNILDFFRF